MSFRCRARYRGSPSVFFPRGNSQLCQHHLFKAPSFLTANNATCDEYQVPERSWLYLSVSASISHWGDCVSATVRFGICQSKCPLVHLLRGALNFLASALPKKCGTSVANWAKTPTKPCWGFDWNCITSTTQFGVTYLLSSPPIDEFLCLLGFS